MIDQKKEQDEKNYNMKVWFWISSLFCVLIWVIYEWRRHSQNSTPCFEFCLGDMGIPDDYESYLDKDRGTPGNWMVNIARLNYFDHDTNCEGRVYSIKYHDNIDVRIGFWSPYLRGPSGDTYEDFCKRKNLKLRNMTCSEYGPNNLIQCHHCLPDNSFRVIVTRIMRCYNHEDGENFRLIPRNIRKYSKGYVEYEDIKEEWMVDTSGAIIM